MNKDYIYLLLINYNLPIHLIDDILNKLSFLDVVRSSTFFENWRYCCRIQDVKFDHKVCETPEDLTFPAIGFIPILDCFFRFHIGITLKVTLYISSQKVCPNVYRFIHLLHKHFIQHFVLKHPFTYQPYNITYFFYICSTLRHFISH